MNEIRTLIQGPAFIQTGYGVHCRMIVTSLAHDVAFDVSIEPVSWGDCPQISKDFEDFEFLDRLRRKRREDAVHPGEACDLFIAVTLPHEFSRRGTVNVGVTAGTETDRVSRQWIECCNLMDLVIVPSRHSRDGFVKTVYTEKGKAEVRLTTPMIVCPEGADSTVFRRFNQQDFVEQERISQIHFQSEFNFLCVGHWWGGVEPGTDRKNLGNTIRYFIEAFAGRSDVGLVLKVNYSRDGKDDRDEVVRRLRLLRNEFPGIDIPPIYLLSGPYRESEMAALYNHPQIQAYLSCTCGEGWGLPLLEAAFCGLPILATNWSGHLDFLPEGLFTPINYELERIPAASVWEPTIIPESKWAMVDREDVVRKLRSAVDNLEEHRVRALKLSSFVTENFSYSVVKQRFSDALRSFYLQNLD
jgi:glycosyltransferase involved in cell wall biosynthesis